VQERSLARQLRRLFKVQPVARQGSVSFRVKLTFAATDDQSQVSAAADVRYPNMNDRNQSGPDLRPAFLNVRSWPGLQMHQCSASLSPLTSAFRTSWFGQSALFDACPGLPTHRCPRDAVKERAERKRAQCPAHASDLGRLVLTVEALADDDSLASTAAAPGYRLQANGRYAHSSAHAQAAAAAAGLAVERIEPQTLRLEAGRPVPGWLVTAHAL